MKLPPQIIRLVLLTLVIAGGYVLTRAVLTPHSWGVQGWYRADALHELTAQEITYAGRTACEECHSEVLTALAAHTHRTLACEICHGPGQAHADNPDVKMGRATAADCLRCHEQDPSRPSSHKQIKSREHYSDARCAECHVPHRPEEAP